MRHIVPSPHSRSARYAIHPFPKQPTRFMIARFHNATCLRSPALSCLLVFVGLLSCVPSYSADVILVSHKGTSSRAQSALELAAQFYGVDLKVIAPRPDTAAADLSRAIQKHTTLAIAVEADALDLVDPRSLLRSIQRRRSGPIPVFVFGLTPDTSVSALHNWSRGSVQRCLRIDGLRDPRYRVSRMDDVTRQLSGAELPLSATTAAYLELPPYSVARTLMSMNAPGGGDLPVFVETTIDSVPVLFASALPPAHNTPDASTPDALVNAFAEIAPAMMFARYAAGDRGWHALHHYANLTIDDPWLREPYGHLNYRHLLAEMDKHRFHTTIAFIPWNYDRSEPDVVSLIRNHPDRYSICIHGDNHDHKEFTDYRDKPLPDQIAALKQALVRMDQFQSSTGIPYDKVMVFPHSIAPEQTLEELKRYNYIATVNSANLPMDRVAPHDLSFAFRPVTERFGGFTSVRRYSADSSIPPAFLAVADFLDNPLIFYCHHDLFANGIGAFNRIADELNRIEPSTRWASLGEIVKHLYVLRLREDSSYDVRAFSSSFILHNDSSHPVTFHVTKADDGHAAIRWLRVDGRDYTYRRHNAEIALDITLPPHSLRSIDLRYDNDLQQSIVSPSKDSARVRFLRTASDLRDLYLSRLGVGRLLVHSYYKGGLRRLQLGLVCITCASLCLYSLWHARSPARTKPEANATDVAPPNN